MKIDLGGKPVVPGFIDCHTHFVQMGIDSMAVDLSGARTLGEAMQLMRSAARKRPRGEWVIATGWKESSWANGRFITRADLDGCCPDHPAVAHRVCGHLSSVNSNAISLLGIDSRTPGVEVDASGNLTGILREGAVSVARSATAPDRSMKLKGLAQAIRRAHSLGVTSVHDNGECSDLDVYLAELKAEKLGVRVWFNVPSSALDSMIAKSLPMADRSDWLRLGGLKVFSDGALGARTAALSEPYLDDPGNRGIFVHERDELEQIVSKANSAGIQLAIHAIGDEGISLAISSLAAALAENPRGDARHRIEHLELPRRAHLRDMRKLKIIASMQPNFVGEWGSPNGMYCARLGEKRAALSNPFREVLRARVRLVFGSDCMPFSPMYGIHSAVNAPYPAQRISVLDALRAYSRDAAFASFEERVKGTVSPGKFADLAVLSADPFSEPSRISSVQVVKTIVGGTVVFERPDATRR
ncbi:MAG: amidohydrolase [Thermoplasmata archaeon]